MIEEEEEESLPLKKKSEELEEFKLIEQEIKASDALNIEEIKEEPVQAEVIISPIDDLSPMPNKLLAENSIPNTLIQSYFPNNEK